MSNARAARRRAQKLGSITPPPGGGQEIILQNPVQEHFKAFIVGNAQHCKRVVEENSASGQSLVICGAGPSLTEHADEYCRDADQVWGCNSALTWLHEHGYPVTHGFTIDQTSEMVAEWFTCPDVEYLVASTVHPNLVEYLVSEKRRLTFFHNYVGIKERPVEWPDPFGVKQLIGYEDWLYVTLYPGTLRTGSGLNAVTRAIDVARFMGFETITVLGADCSIRMKSSPPKGAEMDSPDRLTWLREQTTMHADGGSALASGATAVTFEGIIDSGTPDTRVRKGKGRHWLTKPDLIITAAFLVQMARQIPGLRLIGDTLPNALMGKNAEYFDHLPRLTDSNGNTMKFVMQIEEGAHANL